MNDIADNVIIILSFSTGDKVFYFKLSVGDLFRYSL